MSRNTIIVALEKGKLNPALARSWAQADQVTARGAYEVEQFFPNLLNQALSEHASRTIFVSSALPTALFVLMAIYSAVTQSSVIWYCALTSLLVSVALWITSLFPIKKRSDATRRLLEDASTLSQELDTPRPGLEATYRLAEIAHDDLVSICQLILTVQDELHNAIGKYGLQNFLTETLRTKNEELKRKYDLYVKFGILAEGGYTPYFDAAKKLRAKNAEKREATADQAQTTVPDLGLTDLVRESDDTRLGIPGAD